MSSPQGPASPGQALPQAPPPTGAGPGGPAPTNPAESETKAEGSAAGDSQSGGDSASEPKTLDEPGQGAARQEALRQAQHVIDGDVVGRDKFVFFLSDKKQAAARPLSPLLYEPVQHAFVDPDGWDELRMQFSKRRTAILQGVPGQGRTAMAMRLLMSASTEVMYNLDSRVDLARLCEQLEQDRRGGGTLQRGVGFLLCQPDHVAALRSRELRDLDDALAEADARLVLTVGPDTRLADEELTECLIQLPSAPSFHQIVERHLEWRLGGERAAQELLAREEVQAVLEDLLNEVASCERAAVLAFVISEEPGDAISPARVRERMARCSLDAFDTWFEDLRDIDVRSFAIALAALDGLPYEDVARAAEKLRRRLDPPTQVLVVSPESGQPVSRNRFQMPRRQLLQLLRAEVLDTEIRHPYGLVPSQAVRYKDRSYPKHILSQVWHGYQIHDVLLAWLAELIEEPSEPVFAQVATTLGVLSTFSFHHLLTAVLANWAGSEKASEREAVAYALRVPVADERLRASVTHLINLWFGSADKPTLQATAARVHGLALAGVDPDASLAALERLAREADYKVEVALGASFIDLLMTDASRLAPTILRTLLRWFDSPERADTARLVFLIVANDLVTERAASEPGLVPVSWPSLLELAHDSPGIRDLLVRTWCRVLNEGSYLNLAEKVIDAWAMRAEGDRELLETFVRMVRAVGGTDPRARAILRRCAARWRREDNLFPLPKAAGTAEAVLA